MRFFNIFTKLAGVVTLIELGRLIFFNTYPSKPFLIVALAFTAWWMFVVKLTFTQKESK